MSSSPDLPADAVQFPLLPLRDVVVFPHMVIPLFVGRPKSIKAMETAMEAGKSILLVAQKSAAKDEPGAEDLYRIGCISNILQMLKLPDGTVKVLVEGSQRARIQSISDARTHYNADCNPVPVDGGDNTEVEAMRRALIAPLLRLALDVLHLPAHVAAVARRQPHQAIDLLGVQARQNVIHDDQVIRLALEPPLDLAGVGEGVDHEAFVPQQRADERADRRVVVEDQDFVPLFHFKFRNRLIANRERARIQAAKPF